MKHIKQIDGLRFIAIFFVLIEHFATLVGNFFKAGFYGVDLFFTISGFLITTILLNAKEPFFTAYKKFLGRRTLRIFPLYYAVVGLLYIFHHPYVYQYIFNYLTYTYNYAWVKYQIGADNSASHFWSLSVEEQFYLFWPILMLLFRNNKKVLQVLMLGILALCALQFCLHIFPSVTPYNAVGLFPRAFSLVMGSWGAYLVKENKTPTKMLDSKYVEISVFVLLLTTLFFVNTHEIEFVICPLCSLFLVLKAAHNGFAIEWFNSFLNNKKVLYIGTVSYGIYIFHFPLGDYLNEHLFNPIWLKINFSAWGKLAFLKYHSWIIKFPLYTAISVFIAHYSFHYFEKPILKLKDRFFKYH